MKIIATVDDDRFRPGEIITRYVCEVTTDELRKCLGRIYGTVEWGETGRLRPGTEVNISAGPDIRHQVAEIARSASDALKQIEEQMPRVAMFLDRVAVIVPPRSEER